MEKLSDIVNQDLYKETKIGTEPPKIRTMSDLINQTNDSYEDYKSREIYFPEIKSDRSTRIISGLADAVRQTMYTKDGLQIFSGEVQMAINSFMPLEQEKLKVASGTNLIDRGKVNIQTANRNLDMKVKEYEKMAIPLSDEDKDTFAYKLSGAAVNYGAMMLAGVVTGGVGALAVGGALTVSGEAQEGIDIYKQNTEDLALKDLSPEWARGEALSTTAFGVGSTIIEKYIGVPAQLKSFRTPLGMFKQAGKTAAQEFTEETAQSLLDLGIDVADDSIDWDKVPDRLRGALTDGAIGAVLGGTAGLAVGINNRAKVKAIIEQELQGKVSENVAKDIADNVYNAGNTVLSNALSSELETSSQLMAKHGQIYDSLSAAVHSSISESGAFTDVAEEDIAQYVSETSKIFADQVLVEAKKRNVLVDDIIKSSDISYKDGKIVLKAQNEVIAEDKPIVEQMELFQSEEQDLTPQQKEFFKDTKVVDENLRTIKQSLIIPVSKEVISKSITTPSKGTAGRGYTEQGDSVNAEIARSNGLATAKEISKAFKKQGINISAEAIESSQSPQEWHHIGKDMKETNFFDVEEFDIDSLQKEIMLDAKQKQKQQSFNDKVKEQGWDKLSGEDLYKEYQKITGEKYGSYEDTLKMFNKNNNKARNYLYSFMLQKIPTADPNIYKQGKKGVFNVSERSIKLFAKADFSTLPHELSHFWLDNMWQFERSGRASEDYKKQFQVLRDWLNISPTQTYLNVRQQEKFSRGYEKFLLNGELPSQGLVSVFNNYDRWLKKVYDSSQKLKVNLSNKAVDFFKSMTTGDFVEPSKKRAATKEETVKIVDEAKEDVKDVVAQKKESYNAKPVSVEGSEKGFSSAFSKSAKALGFDAQLEYNKLEIEKQSKLAEEFVNKNPKEAEKIVNGELPPPEGILKNAIYNAYNKYMLNIGDTDAYLESLRNQSLELTRAGQEIASQRGAVSNLLSPDYWINFIQNNKLNEIASKNYKLSSDPKEELNKRINEIVKSAAEKLLNAETVEQQQNIAESAANSLGRELGVQGELFQKELLDKIDTKNNAYNYIHKLINERLGVTISKEDAEKIIQKANSISKSMENTSDGNNPSHLFFKNLSEMEDFANSLNPSSDLMVFTSIIGRGNMLASLKSPFLNIWSTGVNFITEASVRRTVNKLIGKTTYSAVDKTAQQNYIDYAWNVYKSSGYTVSSMEELNTRRMVKGETMVSAQGKGKIKEIGRFFEQIIFKYSMGAPDSKFKDYTFVDSASLEATDIALKEGKTGAELTQRATELFNDATRIEPQTEEGSTIRQKAINDALISTYTNKGVISDALVKVRDVINRKTGSIRLGDLLSPFVKTPANVVSLGFEYSMGGIKAVANIERIINDFKSGKITPKTKSAIDSLARNAIGLTVSALLAALLIDDDDYIPDYDLLSPRDRLLVKENNGVFNSIRIGNKYVNLDYFGSLAMPLTAILNARRQRGILDKVVGYFKGATYQAAKLPVIGDLNDLRTGFMENIDTEDTGKIFDRISKSALDFIASRSIPAGVSDIAKVMDDYEREATQRAVDKILVKIPILREALPEKVSKFTGKPVETEGIISTLFAGSRIKTGVYNSISNEVNRLSKNEAKVSLSNITKTGDLSNISDSEKNYANKYFAAEYSKKVNKLISSEFYKSKSDDDKAKAINDIRSDIVSYLKIKFKKSIKLEKRLKELKK